jgi:hypothetical protein
MEVMAPAARAKAGPGKPGATRKAGEARLMGEEEGAGAGNTPARECSMGGVQAVRK